MYSYSGDLNQFHGKIVAFATILIANASFNLLEAGGFIIPSWFLIVLLTPKRVLHRNREECA